jgi:hypothetical protein
MEYIRTVKVDEKKRIVIDYDQDAENPRTEQWGVSVFQIAESPRYIDILPGKNSLFLELGEILEKTDDVSAFEKFCKRKHIAYRVTNTERGTYIWYVEPKATDIKNPEEFLDGCIDCYNEWADGNVYILTLQTLVTWHNDKGATKEDWEDVDSIAGVYIDIYNDDEVIRTAKEQGFIE